MENIRRYLYFGVFLLIVCSIFSAGNPARAKAAEAITLWAWDESFNVKAAKLAAKEYEREHPEISVQVVLYQRTDSQYVMHRIRCIKKKQREYYMIGDAQNVTEGPIAESQIAAVVTSVCRKGRWLKQGDLMWEFFRRIWLHMISFRSPITRIYTFTTGLIRGRKRLEN